MSEGSPGEQAQEKAAEAKAEEALSTGNPTLQEIAQGYRGTTAEWLLGRIIGWHERITPERQQDIDSILYLLKEAKYIPEDPEHAPFVAMIALIWARLPLAADLTETPKSLMTPAAIGHQFRKVAQEEGWITKKEFLELDKELDRFKDVVVEPKLDKFLHVLQNMADKITGLVNSKSNPLDAAQVIGQLAEQIKTISANQASALNPQKIADAIAEQVVATAKSHLRGIYLLVMALVFMVGLFMGAWVYSFGLTHNRPLPASQPAVHSSP
jgi:hypothetical protein